MPKMALSAVEDGTQHASPVLQTCQEVPCNRNAAGMVVELLPCPTSASPIDHTSPVPLPQTCRRMRLWLSDGVGTSIVDHAVPFQCWEVAPALVVPTAHTSVAPQTVRWHCVPPPPTPPAPASPP